METCVPQGPSMLVVQRREVWGGKEVLGWGWPVGNQARFLSWAAPTLDYSHLAR